MTDMFNNSARSIPIDAVRANQIDELVYVLLYDIDYMVEHKIKNPEMYPDTAVDYIEDSKRINEEIMQTVLEHPRLDPQKVRFFTDPYHMIADISKKYKKIKCILNFCDDFGERNELWSIPIFFDMYKIPYSGYGAKGMQSHNKFYAFAIAKQLGIPVPESYFITKHTIDRIDVRQFPVLVKPNDGGGSEGVSFRGLAHDEDELQTIVYEMLDSYDELIACDYLPGDELTLAMMRQEDEIIPLMLKRIRFEGFSTDPAIYTSDFKWDESSLGHRKLSITEFDGDPSIKAHVIKDSTRLFKVFECKDFARLDWKCDTGGNPKFIDFNENPMYGADSSFLWCLEQSGRTRRDLFNAMIDNLLLEVEKRG